MCECVFGTHPWRGFLAAWHSLAVEADYVLKSCKNEEKGMTNLWWQKQSEDSGPDPFSSILCVLHKSLREERRAGKGKWWPKQNERKGGWLFNSWQSERETNVTFDFLWRVKSLSVQKNHQVHVCLELNQCIKIAHLHSMLGKKKQHLSLKVGEQSMVRSWPVVSPDWYIRGYQLNVDISAWLYIWADFQHFLWKTIDIGGCGRSNSWKFHFEKTWWKYEV